jgi:hypothetical protein
VTGRDPDDVVAYDEWLEKIFVGGARPLQQQIEIREYDPHWPGCMRGKRIVSAEC